MNSRQFITRSIAYYHRYYRLLAAAVVIAVAVIVGSIVVGDSVRHTLISRVNERLLDTESILYSRTSFVDSAILETPLFKGSAKGYLLTNGFVSQGGRLIPVNVWGVTDSLVTRGSSRLNETLAQELGGSQLEDIVLRLPATGVVPSGSLFVTENYTTSIRLSRGEPIATAEGGNLSLKNEQALPLNIFVNRTELGEQLELKQKVNIIMSNRTVTKEELARVWHYDLSGLEILQTEEGCEVVMERVFMQQEVVESIVKHNPQTNRLFSYLANDIAAADTSVPYSFVTAMDSYKGEPLKAGEVILSSYTATRLNAKVGDSVSVSYFTSSDFKTLTTSTLQLVVGKIVPLEELRGDKRLSAEFPGLTNVESCTEWDSDLPIDMKRIEDDDEAYWEKYRATPKALIAYCDIEKEWSNNYGSATAIRIAQDMVDLSALTPQMFGLQLLSPREEGLYAAQNSIDFSSLFLALGFFIIISALLLMKIPIAQMLWQRKGEINLLQSVGFTHRRITALLWRESAPVVLVASLVGILVGLLYTLIIIWLLGGIWKGATHTDGFALYFNLPTVGIGLLVGALLSLCMLYRVIKNQLKSPTEALTTKAVSLRRKGWITLIIALLTLLLLVGNLFTVATIPLFVVASMGFIITACLYADYRVCAKGSARSGFTPGTLSWAALYAHRKQGMLALLSLTLGVFTVFSVGLNRQGFADASQLKSGTGGYSLWGESSVAIYHNLATPAGRERLALTDLPADAEVLQCLRLDRDEASCLNLNKVITPTILGVDMTQLAASDFNIAQALENKDRTTILHDMQQHHERVYPGMVDATVLTWNLGLSLGDTLIYEDERGDEIKICLVATLENSIFQGNLLIDRDNFQQLWPQTGGSEVFLVKVKESEIAHSKNILEQALSEYGVRITPTTQRLKDFYSVTDTYLTIFMTLGGLGLLLGIFCFVIVIGKNLAMRQGEIALLRNLGFNDARIEQILFRENIMIPLYAVVVGTLASLLGVIGGLQHVSLWLYLLALLFTLLFIAAVILFTRAKVKQAIHSVNQITINHNNK